jgi:predicted nicotinamide N-methyase
LLLAVAEGRDLEAWEHAQALAKSVLDDENVVLAKAVLDAGPFAMRKAEALAEAVLGEAVASEVDEIDSKGR